jgi:hypothetical protein
MKDNDLDKWCCKHKKKWNFNNLILKKHTKAQIWSNQSIVLKNTFNALLKWQMIVKSKEVPRAYGKVHLYS